jgi:hypothetical protein
MTDEIVMWKGRVVSASCDSEYDGSVYSYNFKKIFSIIWVEKLDGSYESYTVAGEYPIGTQFESVLRPIETVPKSEQVDAPRKFRED